VQRRLRDTFPQTQLLLGANSVTTVVLVLNHEPKARRRKIIDVVTDSECPDEVGQCLTSLFSAGGHVDKEIRKAYRVSRGETKDEEEDEAELFAMDGADILEGDANEGDDDISA